MRARWRFLFWISLASLIGVAWLGQRLGSSWWQLLDVPLVVMMIGRSIVAFVAMITASRSRWIAWVVLVGWSPMAFDLVSLLPHMAAFVREEDVPAVLFLGGGLLTPLVALWIALAPMPVAVATIARAEIR